MATILNSGIMDSAMLHKTLTPTNSIWLKLICSDWTWWWQPSWICNLGFSHLYTKKLYSCILTQIDDGSHLEFWNLGFSHLHKKTSLIHSDLTWWWQPSWIMPTSIQPFSTKKNFTHSFWLNLMMAAILNSAILDSDDAILDSNTLSSSLRFLQKHSDITLTLTQTNSIWLKLIQYESNSFILTQLDDGSHLEFCQLLFCHFAQKRTSLIHSDSTWWWQPSWILPCWIKTLPS